METPLPADARHDPFKIICGLLKQNEVMKVSAILIVNTSVSVANKKHANTLQIHIQLRIFLFDFRLRIQSGGFTNTKDSGHVYILSNDGEHRQAT